MKKYILCIKREMCCFKCLYSTDNKWTGDMINKFMKIIKNLDEVDTFFEKKFKKNRCKEIGEKKKH